MSQRWAEISAICEANDIDEDLAFLAKDILGLARTSEAIGLESPIFSLILGSLISVQDGSTRVPLMAGYDSAVDRVLKAMGGLEDGVYERIKEELRKIGGLVSTGHAYTPFVVEGDWFYHHKTWELEIELARLIRGHEAKGLVSESDSRGALESLDGADALSTEQKEAVVRACSGGFVVITGGPGTGKTTIIEYIVRTLSHLGVEQSRISLAAPTGKAANRMGERTRSIDGIVAPRTLHRLLEYSVTRRRFGRDRFNPLRQDVVLVDEASMIDLHMMRSILDALGGATLVLIGDAEQLPSVESGTVLRDLKPQSGEVGPRFIRLTQSFRQADDSGGAEILLQARLVRDGSTEGWARMDLAEQWEAQPGVSRLEIQEKTNLEKMVSRWVRTRLIDEVVLREAVGHTFEIREGGFDEFDRQLLEGLFAFTKRERFLCVTKRRATGSIALNEAILSRMEDEFGFKGLGPGVPVMMLHNDYSRGLFNGDQGVVIRARIDREEVLMAVFESEGGFAAHHLNSLKAQVDLSFAMTVHKAQGSEFDHVAVVLPEEPIPLLTRENLYTALTRARRGVLVVGKEEVYRAGVLNPVRRFSGLSEKLGGEGEGQ